MSLRAAFFAGVLVAGLVLGVFITRLRRPRILTVYGQTLPLFETSCQMLKHVIGLPRRCGGFVFIDRSIANLAHDTVVRRLTLA